MWYPQTFAVILGDVDGDGDLDAFVANGHTDDTGELNTVWLNDGLGGFEDSSQRLGSSCCNSNDSRAADLQDLDKDGDLDAIVANSGWMSYDAVWLNTGDGRFVAGPTLKNYHNTNISVAMVVGDLDGDTDLDAWIVDHGQISFGPNAPFTETIDSFSTVWLNEGDGNFRDSGQRLGQWQGQGVAIADVDNDRDLDALILNGESPNTIWINDGSATFSQSDHTIGSGVGYTADFGDLDSDGDLDAFIGNDGPNEIWMNDGSGKFEDSGRRLGDSMTRSVTFADLNGDTLLDVLVIDRRAFTAWLNDGSGELNATRQWGQSYSDQYAVTSGDVDGDGDLDVIAIRFSGHYRVWLNNGQGKFNRVY